MTRHGRVSATPLHRLVTPIATTGTVRCSRLFVPQLAVLSDR